MEISLLGQTAVVTGGNVGIGASIAKVLGQSGADVVLTYFSHQEAAEETVGKLHKVGCTAHAIRLDATDSNQVNAFVQQASELLGGKIDILVNNAGHLVNRVLVGEMGDEHWHRVMNVNLSSAFYCTRAVMPYMTGSKGRIINMSSLAGRNGGGVGSAAYAAAKAGIIGFTRALAKELAPRKITVNALAPGFIVDTPFHETFTGQDNYAGIIANIPLQRAGTPDDVASAALYLASELGAWVTGQVIEINGGAWFV